MQRILVTGGAGFIGSHVCDLLLACGYAVRALDNLNPQVHGPDCGRPDYLHGDVELIVGDVQDCNAVLQALNGVDAVIHLAAHVGVGQSMYDIASYVRANEVGTAVLLEALAQRPVQRLVVASSMSVYGEGATKNVNGNVVQAEERSAAQLRRGRWELEDPNSLALTPIPTPETKEPSLRSVYALNKYAQERMSLIVGSAYEIPTVALRFFNVYGPRQALSNPYTGVLAIFAARLINQRPPLVFEDGLQKRDFVHVSDVARACLLALEDQTLKDRVFNIGSGESRTVLSIADDLARVIGMSQITPHILGKYRAGDIRHCFADIGRAQRELGYMPRVTFETGLAELADWLVDKVADDGIDRATTELEKRGLVA